MSISILKSHPDTINTPDVSYDVTYEGAVLQTFERNGYDDSDFIAIVWDEAEGRTRNVEYATTRGWTYANSAVVDATPDVLAKAQAYLRECAVNALVAHEAALARLATPGKLVRILPTPTGRDRRSRGQVLPAGSTGYVAAREVDVYNTPRYAAKYGHLEAFKVALQYEGRMVWLPEDAVEVVDPEAYEIDRATAEARVPAAERFTNFHTAVPGYINMVG